METKLTIVIPMAGHGTRMRPHTWFKPKPLISVAGKTSLDHLLNSFSSLPTDLNVRYVFIIGPNLGEAQIPGYMRKNYPEYEVEYIVQSEMRGQSDALFLARDHIKGPTIMIFSDTLVVTDFSKMAEESMDGVAWVMPVPDPRRFGVAELDETDKVKQLIEKPDSMENNLALIGCYYFRSGENLISAIHEQFQRDVQLKGEYFLVDAINIMIERGAKMRVEVVDTWLDTGTIQATLDTNRFLLASLREDSKPQSIDGVEIKQPVFIHPEAIVSSSRIGPNVSIGAECQVSNSRIEDCILEKGALIQNAHLQKSILGQRASVLGRGPDDQAASVNLGDDSSVSL